MAQSIAAAGRLSHDGFMDRAKQLMAEGYGKVAENVAMNFGQSDAASVAVSGWIKSPGHQANMSGPSFTLTGVGVAFAADGSIYFAQKFSSR